MGSHVLLVEDDRDLRELLEYALEADGYTVRATENPVEALVQLEFGPTPSVILLNLVMPVMPGSELLDAIRRDARLARIPVVLITGAQVPVEVGRAANAVLPRGGCLLVVNFNPADSAALTAFQAKYPITNAALSVTATSSFASPLRSPTAMFRGPRRGE